MIIITKTNNIIKNIDRISVTNIDRGIGDGITGRQEPTP